MTENKTLCTNVSEAEQKVETEAQQMPFKQTFILNLIALRDDWKKSPVRKYSASDGRAPWFIALAANLTNAMVEEVLPDSIKNDVSKFLNWYADDYGKRHEYPVVDNPKEVNKGYRLITRVLRSFNPELNYEKIDTKEALSNRLLLLKNGHFDENPNRVVHSSDGPWKIRAGWFLSISIQLENALSDGLIQDPVIKSEINKWFDWHSSRFGRTGVIKVTKEYIEKGNKILDKVLASLDVNPQGK